MKKVWIFKLTLAAGSILFAALLGEILYSVYAGFHPIDFSLTAYNRPVAKFDPVRGYRWTPGDARVIRVERGHVVYDSNFRVNNMGWSSARDYSYEKPPNTYRILVFGDSFTSGEILADTWPDLAQNALAAESPGGKTLEIYSFGFDGGGLANWHSVFFGEIVPNFEFDAIVLASWMDNLSRGLTIYHMDEERVYFGRFDRLPANDEDFHAAFLPKMQSVAPVIDDNRINAILADRMKWHWPGFGLATRNLIRIYRGFKDRSQYRNEVLARGIDGSDYRADRDTLDARYASIGGLGKLWAILDYAAANDIEIMIASVPDKDLAMKDALTDGKAPNFHHTELASIAQLYGAPYFNGYEVFRPFAPTEIEEDYWFKYDGHWNNDGARLFATKIAAFIRETWPPEHP